VVDFDSLSFKQGGHLKSNKTTGLPEGSFRCLCRSSVCGCMCVCVCVFVYVCARVRA